MRGRTDRAGDDVRNGLLAQARFSQRIDCRTYSLVVMSGSQAVTDNERAEVMRDLVAYI